MRSIGERQGDIMQRYINPYSQPEVVQGCNHGRRYCGSTEDDVGREIQEAPSSNVASFVVVSTPQDDALDKRSSHMSPAPRCFGQRK